MYLISFPLLLLPFAFFNIVIFLLNIPLTDPVFAILLMSSPTLPPVFDRHLTVRRSITRNREHMGVDAHRLVWTDLDE